MNEYAASCKKLTALLILTYNNFLTMKFWTGQNKVSVAEKVLIINKISPLKSAKKMPLKTRSFILTKDII